MRHGTRVLAALIASVAFVASSVAVSRVRLADATASAPPTGASEDAGSPRPGETTPPDGLDPRAALDLLSSPEAAETAGAAAVRHAAVTAARGPWRSLRTEEWPLVPDPPVYVADVDLDVAGHRVDADVAIAFRPADDTTVLRLLPASTALGDNDLVVEASIGGVPTDVDVDRDGSRLTVDTPAAAPIVLRLRVSYALPERTRLGDDAGPASFGLLAWDDHLTSLGHWLPVLTLPGEDGPAVPWGDVGGFPIATWSVVVRHAGVLVTGGDETPCPHRLAGAEDACTWARGLHLRDVSAVAFPAPPSSEAVDVARIRVHAHVASPGATAAQAEQMLEEAGAAVALFSDGLGGLAWPEVDLVVAPLGEGVAGMEFPGLLLIDPDNLTSLEGGIGTAVLVHEVAHQWFHALVGNGSLQDPVVDESIAQYLTYLFWAEAFGETAAQRLADGLFRRSYLEAVEDGLAAAPPAQPLAEFDGGDAYGPLVYGRGALGWVVAEDAIGRDGVVAFLRSLVEQHGLGVVTDEQLLDEARAFDVDLGAVLERYWVTPEHLTR